jgi:CRISPR-associated endoribonuclease Cas6
VLRGVFGHALGSTACKRTLRDCDPRCILKRDCAYTYLFETIPPLDCPDARKLSDFPRPFVISTAFETNRRFIRGDIFPFDLTLIGTANDYLPNFIDAFSIIGKYGLRTKNGDDNGWERRVPTTKDGNGKFTVESVDTIDLKGIPTTIYQGKLKPFFYKISFEQIKDKCPDTNEVTVQFETPLAIKVQKNICRSAPSFDVLVNAIAWRSMLLNYGHCNGPYIADYAPFVKSESMPVITRSHIAQEKLTRESSRNREKTTFPGIIGHVTYKGEEIRRFLPLLRLAEYVHVGRTTVFGFGKIRLAV